MGVVYEQDPNVVNSYVNCRESKSKGTKTVFWTPPVIREHAMVPLHCQVMTFYCHIY